MPTPSSPNLGRFVFKKTFVASVIALALVIAGCSDDAPGATTAVVPSGETAASTTPDFPRDVLGVTIPARPERIVSASATHTEMIYALGAGDRVVAVDMFSDYPAEVADRPKIDAFNLNLEAVAAFDPDLVILSFDPGDAAAGLAELGIPVILFPTAPATLQDAYDEMTAIGAAVGADRAAAGLVAALEAEVAGLVADIPVGDGESPTYYHELGEDLYSITSNTFIGSIYSLAGLRNIADPADDTGSGYPQLSAEYILQADPDFIFLADTVCCGQSAATLAGRPGWETLTAVREGRVIELDDDVASRWGPRIVDFLRTVTTAAYAGTG
ncbi:MAG: ABC transporter substrate-binding protein [Actinobacteria bacterium]|nr:ABC transporter substrate-binding protein [Actinomycetota bacterium]